LAAPPDFFFRRCARNLWLRAAAPCASPTLSLRAHRIRRRGLTCCASPCPRVQDAPKYPWMNKRDKMMPWTARGGSACDLFDVACGKKEKAAKAAAAAAE